MAATEATEREPAATNGAVHVQRLERIGRARGVEAAGARQKRRHQPPVEVDGERQKVSHELQGESLSNEESSAPKAATSSAEDASRAAGRAMTTNSTGGQRCRRRRNTSRSCRFTRARTTAFPTLLETVRPSRAEGPDAFRMRPTSGPTDTFLPRCCTRRKSARLRMRAERGNPSVASARARRAPGGLLLGRGGGEPLPALRAPALEHGTPGLGGVTLAETVGAVSPQLGGLVRTLGQGPAPSLREAARLNAKEARESTRPGRIKPASTPNLHFFSAPSGSGDRTTPGPAQPVPRHPPCQLPRRSQQALPVLSTSGRAPSACSARMARATR